MKKKIKILMVPCSNSGVTYWRMFNFWEAFHRNHLADCRVLWWTKDLKTTHPWEEELRNPLSAYRLTDEMNAYAKDSDVIIFQMVHIRESLAVIYALKDAYPHIPILAEIDDDITYTPTYNIAEMIYKPGSTFTEIALKQFMVSDAMIVSTPYLQEVYAPYNERIYQVPNCIDFKLWGKVRTKSKPGIRIGWSGGASHDEDLRIIEPIIPKIVKANPSVRFVMIHGVPYSMREINGVKHVRKFARIDRYPQHIADQDWDIAMGPLVDNSFNRSKSNLRWLEAGALGIPTVASDVGHFASTVHHGVDGFLASNADEFENFLQILISDRKLRKRIGTEARERIRNDFNVDKIAGRYISFIEDVIERGPIKFPPTNHLGIEDDIKPLPIMQNELNTTAVEEARP